LDAVIKKHLLVDTMNLLNITDSDRKSFLMKRVSKRESETRDTDSATPTPQRIKERRFDEA